MKVPLLVLLACTGTALAGNSPDLSGVWQIEAPITQLRAADGSAPPLRADAARVYRMRSEAAQRGDYSFDPSVRQCRPPGEPRVLYDLFPFEIVQTPQQIFFTYQWNKLYRIVDIEQPHPIIAPTYFGTSNARWRGSTLEIDVTGLHEDTLLDASGLPHSDALHLIERFELDRGGRELSSTIRIEDPKTFTRPWEVRLRFRKLDTDRLGEDVCEERLGYVK